jgi:hypothetical protein
MAISNVNFTCCHTISQGHDNFDVLRPELMNGLCWLCEGRELGAVEADVMEIIAVDNLSLMKAKEGSSK